MTDAHDRSRLSGAEWAIVVVTLLFVAVQAALPAFITRPDDHQVEFAWDLYSKGAPRQHYAVITADGVDTFDLVADLPIRRAVIDYPDHLPPWLCERFGALEIEVTVGGDVRTHSCP